MLMLRHDPKVNMLMLRHDPKVNNPKVNTTPGLGVGGGKGGANYVTIGRVKGGGRPAVRARANEDGKHGIILLVQYPHIAF